LVRKTVAPIKVGIAGYMGCGKSTGARILARTNGTVIDADLVAKDLMNRDDAIRKGLIGSFGEAVIKEKGILFDALGEVAFRSFKSLLTLNGIVHPKLLELLNKEISGCGARVCILDAALISYWQIEHWFDVLYWIQASEDIRLKRLIQKAALAAETVKKRMQLQQKLFTEPKKGKWNILLNEGTLKEFEEEIEKNSIF
jgi:dephospho-CoA kinase